MSETSGVCTIGVPGRPKFGRVGTAMEGVKIRIAEDGEIQLHGRIMTRGYLRLETETDALYTDDGWLCTGDIGDVDVQGHLAITGRKKELLITAGGKNVAPVEMESHMQPIFGVANAVVVGDRKPYLSALITIDVEALDVIADRFGGPADLGSLAKNEKFRAHIESSIESDCNSKVARYQTIKKFHLLAEEFTVEGGELTPTMKLRRKEITAKYAAEIAAFYDDSLTKA
jgi:long-chain acyl-CoA synthetase